MKSIRNIIPGQHNKLHKTLKDHTRSLYLSFKTPCVLRMVILAAIIGVIGGLGAVGFHYLILGFKNIFFGATSTDTFLDAVRALPWYYRLFVPAIGGLIVGPLVTYIVSEARGHGVPEVMEAVTLHSGAIRFRVAPLKALVSAICIGSGGSAGREGPIVQIGASFGSAVGGFLNLTPEKVETLLGAGAAAGIAGTFNAPLAGVIFSLEVLLRKIKIDSFSPIVVSAVVGTAVANSLFERSGPIFDIPVHQLISYWELMMYLGLGLIGSAVAIIYGNTLYSMEHIFEKIPVPEEMKDCLGGLMLGALALMIPQIHSTGYPVMESALHGRLPLQVVFVFMTGKILATIITLGSGGSGGIFAPSLFIGSMMGSTYGQIVHTLLPGITASSSSYAMVGMGAVFAGATHAPLTAIIILFEMTRDPKIILPLMFACIISSMVSSRIQKRNIYTTKLLNRGVNIDSVRERNILENIQAREVMNTDLVTVAGDTPLDKAKVIFHQSLYNHLPVLESRTRKLIGILGYQQVVEQLEKSQNGTYVARDFVHSPSAVICENDTLFKALQLINDINIEAIPVMSGNGCDQIVGLLSLSDILTAYHKQII